MVIFGALFSSRSIQGDRYIQGRYIGLTVDFSLLITEDAHKRQRSSDLIRYTLFLEHVLLSKRKRGRRSLLFSPSCV